MEASFQLACEFGFVVWLRVVLFCMIGCLVFVLCFCSECIYLTCCCCCRGELVRVQAAATALPLLLLLRRVERLTAAAATAAEVSL